MHFWSFWAKYWHFLPISSIARPKNNANKVPRMFVRYVGNKTFDFSSKKRDFCPKTTKFGPKLAFLFILGQALPAHLVPCWWVGWWLWRAGCILQDTYLLSIECFWLVFKKSVFCKVARCIMRVWPDHAHQYTIVPKNIFFWTLPSFDSLHRAI